MPTPEKPPKKGLRGLMRRVVQSGQDYFERITGHVYTGDGNVTTGSVSGNMDIQQAGRDLVAGDKVEGDQIEATMNHVQGGQVGIAKELHQVQHIQQITYTSSKPSWLEESAPLREAYLNQLFETCGQVLLAGIDRKATAGQKTAAGLKLNGIYTALLTRASEQGMFARGPSMEHAVFEEERESGRRLSAVEQLNRHTRLVLLGDPGSGKSTFVNFVTLCLAGELLDSPHARVKLLTAPLPDEEGNDQAEPQPWNHGALLPVRVILRDFAAEGLPPAGQPVNAKHLWDFLVKMLTETPFADYVPFLQKHLLELGGLVLLDGLDEVPAAQARRVQIKQVVEDFARSFPQCRIVVTSRTYAYQAQDWQLSGFAQTVLAPFTKGQILRFVNQWYQHSAEVLEMRPDDAHRRADLLQRAIFSSDRLYDFAQRPLLLTLMASLHAWRGGSLPEKRAELYNDAVELLLDWWESRKVKDPDGRVVSLAEVLNLGREGLKGLRTMISTLAYDAHASQPELVGTADISGAKLAGALRVLCKQCAELNPNQVEAYLRDRAGLLVEHGVDVYTFPHRTFQEYLAACYLTDTAIDGCSYPANAARLVRVDPNRWREVMLLSAAKAVGGYSAAIWGIAEALYQKDVASPNISPADVWGALLAGQIIHESADLTQIGDWDRPKLQQVKAWLAAILTEQVPAGEPFPATERTLAGNLLAHLGDHRPGVGVLDNGFPEIVWCEVPAGEFLMGSTSETVALETSRGEALLKERHREELIDPYRRVIASEHPQHLVQLSPYRISRYLVTNAHYQAFVNDGGYTQTWKTCWTSEGWKWREQEQLNGPRKEGGDFDLPNHPVVHISWYEATAFCQWLTFYLRESGELSEDREIRLPTEAEWERAARGTDGALYPWGDAAITPDHANYYDTQLGSTSAVGCFPRGVSSCGCDDLIGNVWEWCWDWYAAEYYKKSPKENPPGPTSGSGRVGRGGGFGLDAEGCRAACRYHDGPAFRSPDLGFRLLRT